MFLCTWETGANAAHALSLICRLPWVAKQLLQPRDSLLQLLPSLGLRCVSTAMMRSASFCWTRSSWKLESRREDERPTWDPAWPHGSQVALASPTL